MSDDLDELDAALRRAMAALDGDAPAGYFEALPGRTLARLEDLALGAAIDELPEEPARPLRAVQGLRPPADGDDDDDAVFASQVMAAVELPEPAELSEPDPWGALPRHDRASASSAILQAVEDAADGGERGEMRREPASASSVGMRVVAVDAGAGELGDPRETGVAGSDLGARSASSRIPGRPVPPVELARPEAAVGARSVGAAASMTEAGRGRRGRRVRAAIVGIGGIGLAAVAAMYLRAGDRASDSAPSIVSNRGPASPSAGSGPSASSPAAGSAASADPGAGGGTVVSAKPGAADGPGSGSAATTAAAGSGVVPGLASGSASEPGGKLGPLVKRPGSARPPAKAGGKPEVQLGPGAGKGAGAGAVKPTGGGADALPSESGEPGKKLKSSKPRPDRTSLSGDDIERAMTAVAGQARACFAGIRGTVPLRVTVAPSGRALLVAVIGEFAGTPSGACVKRVVLAATFPAWSGAPQSFDYSYLLSD